MIAANSAGGAVIFVVYIAFLALYFASMWKIWQKMGDAGWMGIVPILNYYRIFQRSKPENAILWTIGSFFCCIGVFVAMYDLAKLFGKELGYALGLIFLPFIFLPLLAFGDATYQGPPAPNLG